MNKHQVEGIEWFVILLVRYKLGLELYTRTLMFESALILIDSNCASKVLNVMEDT